MIKEDFYENIFYEQEAGSMSYQQVERMMLNSKVIEPLYKAIPLDADDEFKHYFDQDWSRRNLELKKNILEAFEDKKECIYKAASQYRLNMKRIRNVLSELAGNYYTLIIF